MKVIDASGAVLGRMASYVAKDLLKGEQVVIVNAEKTVITGRREATYAHYKQWIDRADRTNPLNGPHFPRRPDMIVKRTVRGMVNYKSGHGKLAFRRLRVYLGVPKDFEGKAEKFAKKPTMSRHVTLEEMSEWLGWTNHLKR